MSVDPEARVTIAPSVYVRPFGEELVVLDFGRGEYFGLDEVGAVVWRSLEAGKSVDEATSAVVERFDVERDVALRDVVALVRELADASLLAVTAAGARARDV